MTTTRSICGYREGVDAHRAAGEPLCPACKASAAKRARIRASKRHARHDVEDEGCVDLASINTDTLHDAMHRGWGDHGR